MFIHIHQGSYPTMTHYKNVVYPVSLSNLVIFQTAYAQLPVSVVYSPLSTAVPAAVPVMGSGLMIVLAGMLVLVAAWCVQRARKTDRMFITIALAAGLALTITGVSQVSEAIALGVTISGANCEGGESPFDAGLSGQPLTNDCDNKIRVDDYVGGCPAPLILDSSECPVGTVLDAGGRCNLPFCSQGGG
jgi:hypothetical protein